MQAVSYTRSMSNRRFPLNRTDIQIDFIISGIACKYLLSFVCKCAVLQHQMNLPIRFYTVMTISIQIDWRHHRHMETIFFTVCISNRLNFEQCKMTVIYFNPQRFYHLQALHYWYINVAVCAVRASQCTKHNCSNVQTKCQFVRTNTEIWQWQIAWQWCFSSIWIRSECKWNWWHVATHWNSIEKIEVKRLHTHFVDEPNGSSRLTQCKWIRCHCSTTTSIWTKIFSELFVSKCLVLCYQSLPSHFASEDIRTNNTMSTTSQQNVPLDKFPSRHAGWDIQTSALQTHTHIIQFWNST